MAIRLLGDAQATQHHVAKVDRLRQELDRLHLGRPGGGAPFLIGLRGEEPHQMALMADGLIADGYRLALLPKGAFDLEGTQVGASLDALVDLDEVSVAGRTRTSGASLPPFDVINYTSGSTGQPKAIGVTLDNLRLTADWYRLIYRLDKASVIVTSLPFSYNFTFVAAFCQALFYGTSLAFGSPQELPGLCQQQVQEGRRTILLANPITLEHLLDDQRGTCPGLLIDSGGAPLSQYAIETIRAEIADLREGYGLSETCSLTHFDLMGDARSLGTVGQPMPGVVTELRCNAKGQPELWIKSPNTCSWVEATGLRDLSAATMMNTGDLAAVDPNGNLRLLARADDHQINGLWPRDTLNLLGPTLGTHCAMIQHKEQTPRVRINLWRAPDRSRRDRIMKQVSAALGLPCAQIGVHVSGGNLLHSIKLPRR